MKAEARLEIGHVEVVRRTVVLVHRRDVLLVDVALAELGDALLEQLLLVSEAEIHVALLSVGTMLQFNYEIANFN